VKVEVRAVGLKAIGEKRGLTQRQLAHDLALLNQPIVGDPYLYPYWGALMGITVRVPARNLNSNHGVRSGRPQVQILSPRLSPTYRSSFELPKESTRRRLLRSLFDDLGERVNRPTTKQVAQGV
jgi:hypothetical protein